MQIVSKTICICQILFSVKNKKIITNLSSAELAQRGLKLNLHLQQQQMAF